MNMRTIESANMNNIELFINLFVNILFLLSSSLSIFYITNYFIIIKNKLRLQIYILELAWIFYLPFFLLTNIITKFVIIFTILEFGYIYFYIHKIYNIDNTLNKYLTVALSFSLFFYGLSMISEYLMFSIFMIYQIGLLLWQNNDT